MSAKTLLGLPLLLLPLAACPSDDEPTATSDMPAFTACEADVDFAGNGNVDARWVYTYEDGNLVKEELDSDLDGIVDELCDHTFEGDFETRYRYSIRDVETGEVRLSYAEERTPDAEGRNQALVIDLEGDGTFDEKLTYVYDSEGRLSETQIDSGNDGTIDELRKNFFVDGNVSYAEIDSGNDGTIDSKVTYTYDDEGRLTLRERDDGVDGTVNRTDTTTYESHGWVETHATNRENDGVADTEIAYTYENEKLKSWLSTYRFAGQDELVERLTFGYECASEKPGARRDRAHATARLRDALR